MVAKHMGITGGQFLEVMGFFFILKAVSEFVYVEAERFGVSWLWFSNKWVFCIVIGIVFGTILGSLHVGAKRFGITRGLFLKGGICT
ncbi:hypothetical protein [Bartonella vinsonii]|uniref:hypothetical protein n=2 Tax=Bartonella vinsonii TaxID=33047 RepID=UPI000478F189|nr:hypothetical protein [Bartonella vinsonii]